MKITLLVYQKYPSSKSIKLDQFFEKIQGNLFKLNSKILEKVHQSCSDKNRFVQQIIIQKEELFQESSVSNFRISLRFQSNS